MLEQLMNSNLYDRKIKILNNKYIDYIYYEGSGTSGIIKTTYKKISKL